MARVGLSGLLGPRFGGRRGGRWGLRDGDFGRVKVDAVCRGVVVSVGPSHCVQKLTGNKREESF